MEIKDWLERLETRLERMEDKADVRNERFQDRLNDIDTVLVRQNIVLEDHTRRSLTNEEGLALMREETSARMEVLNRIANYLTKREILTVRDEMRKRLQKEANKMKPKGAITPVRIGKIAAAAGAIGAAIGGILKALGKV